MVRCKHLLIRKERKCRNKEGAMTTTTTKTNKSVMIKQGPCSFSRNRHSNIFFFFCSIQDFQPDRGWYIQAQNKIPGAPPCYLTTNQSGESLHTVEDNEDWPTPKMMNVTFLLLKLSWLSRIFRVGFWKLVYLLSSLLASWVKQSFLFQATLISWVLAFEWQADEPVW